MAFCQSCGAAIDSGTKCQTCATSGAFLKIEEFRSVITGLIKSPAETVNNVLTTQNLRVAYSLAILVIGLRLASQGLWYMTTTGSAFWFKGELHSWISWLTLYGGWVAGLTFAATRVGRPLRWESMLGAYALLRILPESVTLIRNLLPRTVAIIPDTLGYFTAVIYWGGLVLLARVLTQGDDNRAVRFLLTAAVVPAAAHGLWSLLRL